MKKTLAVILALTMVLCLALTSCDTKDNNTDKKNETENSNTESIAAYNEYLEGILEEFKEKSELDKEVLATVNGLPVSAANVKYTYLVVDAPYSETLSEEEIKTEIERFYRENATLVDYAYKNNIKLTDEDITTIKANIAAMELQLGEEYDKAFAESPFTEFFYYFQTSVLQALYTRICDDMIANRDAEITKASFETAKSEMVRAKHILIQFPEGEGENGELTDAQKADTLARAEAALAEVNAMNDISEFDALIEKYNEDPGMESNPDGYYFGKGEMVQEFEESAYSLEEGKTSGLVETSYGYHILLKLPLEDDEAIYNSQAFFSIFNDALYKEITKDLDSFTVEYAGNHDERIADFEAEYNALTESAETALDAEAETEDTAEAAE